nr:hypothetical protein [Tanacetum cinerariifolium]
MYNDELEMSMKKRIPLSISNISRLVVKVNAPTQELDNGFVEVTSKHEKGKQNGKHRHIDGVRLTKPPPNYFYRVVSKPVNVNDEASTSQPKGN